jgi:hypothetical protein
VPPHVHNQLRQDLDVIERFARTYREQFSVLIEQLNADPTPQTGRQCLRLCVEAVSMLLATQNQMASALRSLSDEHATDEPAPRKPAA